MQHRFEQLINTFLDNKIGICPQFLAPSLLQDLKKNLVKLYSSGHFKDAGTSNKTIVLNKEIRGDQIYWLDRSHKDECENLFFDIIDTFVLHLNSTCYTGITGYEFHYALYPPGSFYKKHLDQFRSNDSRKYSMIIYLNDEWTEGDGGELCVHHSDESKEKVQPITGNTIFFDSGKLVHEVLKTNKPRMSITGWLKC